MCSEHMAAMQDMQVSLERLREERDQLRDELVRMRGLNNMLGASMVISQEAKPSMERKETLRWRACAQVLASYVAGHSYQGGDMQQLVAQWLDWANNTVALAKPE